MAYTLPPEEDQKNDLPLSKDTGLTEQSDPLAKARATKETDDLEAAYNEPSYTGKDAGDNNVSSGAGGNTDGGGVSRLTNGFKSAAKFAGKNKKKLLVGGGLTAGFGGLGIALFLALLPLKMEAMMKNILAKRAIRVESAMDQKAGRLVGQYYANKIFGDGKYIVAGGPIATAFATWETNGFERDLKARHGIEVSSNGRGGALVKFDDGRVVDLKNLKEFKQFFNARGDQKNSREAREFRAASKNITRWSVVKDRRHVRKFMAQRYGVKRWAHTSRDGTAEEFNENFERAATEDYKTRTKGFLSRILGTDGQKQQATDSLVDDISGVDTSTDISDNAMKELIEKGVMKVIPVIGWIDIGVRLDNAGRKNVFGDWIKEKNAAQYVHMFSFWASTAAGFKEGEISGEQVNAAMNKISNIENSAAYHDTFLDSDGGEGIKEENRVDWDKTDHMASVYSKVSRFTGLEFFSRAWLDTVSPIIDSIGSFAGEKINAALGLIKGYNEARGKFAEFMADLVNKFFKPVVTKHTKDASLMNAVNAGGDVTYNEFAKEHGAKEISPAKATASNIKIVAEIEAERNEQSIYHRLTDTSNPSAPLTRLAMATPSSPDQAIGSMFAYLGSLATNPVKSFMETIKKSFSSPAKAYTYRDLTGQKQYDWDQADIDADFTEETVRSEVEQCNDSPKPAQCKLNTLVLQSMTSMYTKEDDGGLGSIHQPPTENTPTPTGAITYPANMGGPNSMGYYQLPDSLDNSYTSYTCKNKSWGKRELIGTITTVASRWKQKYPQGHMYVGDLNASGHSSHKYGVGVDLLASTNGKDRVADFEKGNYNRDATIELGKIFVATGMIKNIWYNDNIVNDAVKAYARENGYPLTSMKYVDGHDDHFHIDIEGTRGPVWEPNC